MIKILKTIRIGFDYAKSLFLGLKNANLRGLTKNPLFYFGLTSFILFGTMYLSCDSFASYNGLGNSRVVFFNSFFNNSEGSDKGDLFFSKGDALALETPDLKIMQDNTIAGVATPSVVSAKVLGDVFGSNSQNRKDIIDYMVQPGDTLQSVANFYQMSVNTLLWANDLSKSSSLKVGQVLTILPTDGVLHIVKSGDTVSAIAQKYKADDESIIAFNSLANQDDIYIGDILIVPGGTMPKTSGPLLNNQIPLADNFFIYPVEGRITQGLHFYNAVDIANKCGTPVYAAASGTVQRVRYGYNFGGGNNVTILHSNGTVTYYGHLMTIFIKPGDKVTVGDRIALVGGGTGTVGDGLSTGCHLHFEVVGAKNPLSKYYLGTTISLK